MVEVICLWSSSRKALIDSYSNTIPSLLHSSLNSISLWYWVESTLLLGTNEKYSNTGLPAFTKISLSSTVPGSATPVGVPSRVLKVPIRMSQLSANCLFKILCGLPHISEVALVCQKTSSSMALYLSEFAAFQESITSRVTLGSYSTSAGETIRIL